MFVDQALRAVTLSPAEMFGVADRYGSLDPGKIANLSSGRVTPSSSPPVGSTYSSAAREMPLTTGRRSCFERYKTLPPKY